MCPTVSSTPGQAVTYFNVGEFGYVDGKAENEMDDELGAEVVAPLGNAMRFVDGEEGDWARGEQLQGSLVYQTLWCEVEEIDVAVRTRGSIAADS